MFTVVTFPGKVALAPLAGAVNVTAPPATGSEKALLTVATRGRPNTLRICVLCGVPLLAEMLKPRDSNAPMSTVVLTMRSKPVPR